MQTPKVTAEKNAGLQDDHDPSDVGQRTANKGEQSQKEGPAAYAPTRRPKKPGRGRPKKTERAMEMVGEHDLPKNQQTCEPGQTLGEDSADQPIGFARKPMLDEHQERSFLGGHGLRGPDKSQGELRDVDATRKQPREGGRAVDRAAHQDAHGPDVHGEPLTVQTEEALPEGLRRERKGPYDKNVGRAEAATEMSRAFPQRDPSKRLTQGGK